MCRKNISSFPTVQIYVNMHACVHVCLCVCGGVGWILEERTQSSHPKVVSAYQFRTKKKAVIRM